MLQFVSATRVAGAEFASTALGASLSALKGDSRIGARVAVNNRRGLGEIYNEAIEAGEAEAFVFVHDDVWVRDADIVERIAAALRVFDIVGVVGNQVFHPRHLKWTEEPKQLSGLIGLGDTPAEYMKYRVGPAPARCSQVDGMFIAARASVLKRTGLRFDPQFRFHFYDMDFCRSAHAMKLRIGTWPLELIHRAGSSYDTHAWFEARDLYAEKWGITALDPPKGYRPATEVAA